MNTFTFLVVTIIFLTGCATYIPLNQDLDQDPAGYLEEEKYTVAVKGTPPLTEDTTETEHERSSDSALKSLSGQKTARALHIKENDVIIQK